MLLLTEVKKNDILEQNTIKLCERETDEDKDASKRRVLGSKWLKRRQKQAQDAK